MLRIHLTPHDIATLRLLPSLGPLGETLHSMTALRRQPDGVALSTWRRQVHRTLDTGLRRLPAAITSAHSHLALAGIADARAEPVRREFATAANAVLAADRDRTRARADADLHVKPAECLRNELRELGDECGIPLRFLHQICAYHRSAIAPVWGIVRAQHANDRTSRARTMMEQGVEGLLNTLHPRVRWSSPTLSLLDGTDGEIHLDGRGLALVPSFFLRKPVLLLDPAASGATAVLIYPIRLDTTRLVDIWTTTDAEWAIGKLLGRTRAQTLAAIASGTSTTGDIARRIGVSAAAVSQHLNVLRDARLIVTHRHGADSAHSITARGLDLLERWDSGSS
ncbi:ArsR family transcriptional regulator [Pseudonocardia hierapolitana]|uniref:ArsR family transcriptional regulator n=1 Tax=Pseudonocardia hierapolitana TaxID=1128676 RepID=A0A561SQX4_9PSEU|nr:ArsR family transcriptional regulator [Pseudonocardia hierapolitana]TWF77259.1 ArsR family transcriptional regulator [Pseudonocardia hierapolitana]